MCSVETPLFIFKMSDVWRPTAPASGVVIACLLPSLLINTFLENITFCLSVSKCVCPVVKKQV